MRSAIKKYLMFYSVALCSASFHDQYAVISPRESTNKWESFIYGDREYIIENINVNWENAQILCRGHHNASLVVLDSKHKATFLAEALAESQFAIESVWVGARRASADDPSGYRWSTGSELQRTALDVLPDEGTAYSVDKYPAWLNRTHVPVPDGGADCVAMERVQHDRPVFLDLPCQLERGFACEREAVLSSIVTELHSVRCRNGLYRVFDARLTWHQAATYCILRKMALANIGSMRCLKKLGMTMLKSRPSIETAWIGASGTLGKWSWTDTGVSIFTASASDDEAWPPLRSQDKELIRPNGCLQLDRHVSHPPVFLETRCERKMQFICYQGLTSPSTTAMPKDDLYRYLLVKQKLTWQQAFDNCKKENGNLASIDSLEILIQLLLVMGENKEDTITHIWLSGHLNMTKDPSNDVISYSWTNPTSGKRIYDTKHSGEAPAGVYVPPWLDEDFSMDNSCLNLDRLEHLSGLVYGLPCDTAQYSVCMIDIIAQQPPVEVLTENPTINLP